MKDKFLEFLGLGGISQKGEVGRPLSEAQCRMAAHMFGEDHPDVAEHCGHVLGEKQQADVVAMAAKNVRPFIDKLKSNFAALQEDLLEVDERLARLESAAMDKRMFTTRMGAAMFSDGSEFAYKGPAGDNPRPQWTDNVKSANSPFGPNPQKPSDGKMQGWYKRG